MPPIQIKFSDDKILQKRTLGDLSGFPSRYQRLLKADTRYKVLNDQSLQQGSEKNYNVAVINYVTLDKPITVTAKTEFTFDVTIPAGMPNVFVAAIALLPKNYITDYPEGDGGTYTDYLMLDFWQNHVGLDGNEIDQAIPNSVEILPWAASQAFAHPVAATSSELAAAMKNPERMLSAEALEKQYSLASGGNISSEAAHFRFFGSTAWNRFTGGDASKINYEADTVVFYTANYPLAEDWRNPVGKPIHKGYTWVWSNVFIDDHADDTLIMLPAKMSPIDGSAEVERLEPAGELMYTPGNYFATAAEKPLFHALDEAVDGSNGVTFKAGIWSDALPSKFAIAFIDSTNTAPTAANLDDIIAASYKLAGTDTFGKSVDTPWLSGSNNSLSEIAGRSSYSGGVDITIEDNLGSFDTIVLITENTSGQYAQVFIRDLLVKGAAA